MLKLYLNACFRFSPKDRAHQMSPLPHETIQTPGIHRSDSTTEFHPSGEEKEVEYFFASDARLVETYSIFR